MYIQRKQSKSSRIHIVYCLPEAFLSRIQCVYDEKILQIRAYTIFLSTKNAPIEKNPNRRIFYKTHDSASAPYNTIIDGYAK